jgi:hypothetical protein
MRNFTAALSLLGVLALSTPSAFAAVDVASMAAQNQANCDAIKSEVSRAQNSYLQAHTPSQNPVQTFDDAISNCLDFITNFQVSIPSLYDGILSTMAKQLMQRACQTATGQFNQAVNTAKQSVNGAASGATGGIITSPVSTGQGGTGVSVSSDNGSLLRNTANTATNRVINLLN